MIKGRIFNIQRFCLDDGPGVRTTVFLKGCPLHCAWCHNPESQMSAPEVLFDLRNCIACGACAAVCPAKAHKIGAEHLYERSLCISCGACTEACPTEALALAGREVTVDEVLAKILRDRPFYETSGGGVTLSGGEPLAQTAFSCALLAASKEADLHTCVETCGYASETALRKLAEVTDLFLYDWKLTDSELHRRYTGVGNERIRENLLLLDEMGSSVILRCPIIPGINDTEAHLQGIGTLAELCPCVTEVDLEPYHTLGIQKLHRLERQLIQFDLPSKEAAQSWKEQLSRYTAKTIKIG